jgi:hypothetical protein
MKPDQVEYALQLVEEVQRLQSICEELQKSQFDVSVGSIAVLEAINFDAEAMMRIAQPIWLEVRRHLSKVIKELSELGVDVSEQRKRFDESSDWRPTPWNQSPWKQN